MSIFRSTILPRILSGIMGVLTLLLTWGSLQSLFAYGPSSDQVLTLAFALPLTVICFSVAWGCAPFQIRDR
jgi:hypothetical protein